VLDLSSSMDATDLKPSRLTLARFKVLDILNRTKDGQVGLIVFAGDAFVVSPLTDDVQTIAALVPVLTSDIMPAQGSRIARGLLAANALLDHGGISGGDVVVVTDGASDAEESMDAVREIRSKGRRVSFLGVGTPQGAPIPLAHGGIMKDADGAIVIPKLDPVALQQLAKAGGGQFSRITTDSSDVTSIILPQSDHWFMPVDSTALSADQWREDGIWLVLLLLPVACLAFRRGWILVLVLMLGIPPQRVEAFDWEDVWLRDDQQGDIAMRAGDAAGAAELFKDNQWRATAHYRSGQFQRALEAFSTSDSADAQYNRGNTFIQLGDLRNAIAAYDLALERDPYHIDALHNKTILENHLRRLQAVSNRRNSRRAPQGESTDSLGLGRVAQGNQGDVDDSLARREEESETLKEGIQADLDDDYEASLDAEFSLADIQSSLYSTGKRVGQQREDKPSVQALDDIGEASNSRSNSLGFADTRLTMLTAEQRQAMEQWLRRIPDDPGGLLRRKLLLEHKRRQLTEAYDHSATPW